MIYTVTFNPSLDYIATVENFVAGRVNRTVKELMLPGGKGLNVSIVLKNLGIDSSAFGFVAGFTGEEIKKQISEYNIKCDFVEIKEGISRINVKLHSKEESEINGMGPVIDAEALEEFYKKIDKLQKGDILVLAGSIPTGMPDTIYQDLMERLKDKGIRIIVDATKKLLVNVLKYHPFMIKPNNYELGEIFGINNLTDKQQVVEYAKKLKEMGALNVLVSMAGDGAVLVDETGKVYMSEAPKGEVKNSVGAGDSMVAGFIYGYLSSNSYEEAFKYGLYTGSASAFSDNLATKEDMMRLLEKETII